jgi:hypothetical protein
MYKAMIGWRAKAFLIFRVLVDAPLNVSCLVPLWHGDSNRRIACKIFSIPAFGGMHCSR